MKEEDYIRLSERIRKFRYGESIVQYGNIFVTRVVYVAYLVILIILMIQRDSRLVRVILVTGISFVIVSIIRHLLNAPRPYTVYEFDPIIKKDKVGDSMPSRHVFSVFVIGMAFFYLNPVLGILFFIDGFFMCIGRVVAGVHFPKDVIVGAVIGVISGIIGFYII